MHTYSIQSGFFLPTRYRHAEHQRRYRVKIRPGCALMRAYGNFVFILFFFYPMHYYNKYIIGRIMKTNFERVIYFVFFSSPICFLPVANIFARGMGFIGCIRARRLAARSTYLQISDFDGIYKINRYSGGHSWTFFLFQWSFFHQYSTQLFPSLQKPVRVTARNLDFFLIRCVVFNFCVRSNIMAL